MRKILFLFLVFAHSLAFAEVPAQRVQFEPAKNVSISTVRCAVDLVEVKSLRGRKEITIKNIEATTNAYIFVSPNTVGLNNAWELAPNHFIRLAIDEYSTVYVSSSTVKDLKVIQIR